MKLKGQIHSDVKTSANTNIAPTKLAVLLMAVGVPVTLGIAIFWPFLWALGAAWIAMVLALVLLDTWMAPGLSLLEIKAHPPAQIYIGEQEELCLDLVFARNAPSSIEVTLQCPKIAKLYPACVRAIFINNRANAIFSLCPARRGEININQIWVRWPGPFGFISKSRTVAFDIQIPVMANIRAVRDQAIQIFSRDQIYGQKLQKERGEGTEFDSLREFVTGMDHRRIDWKASARHNVLLAKEFRTERNHNIMIVLDTGYLMSAPLAGIAKIDHALNAGLLLAYIGLRTGDRVGFFSFDAYPGLICKPLVHASSFGILQRITAKLEYSSHETNFTLGLSQLKQSLDRRSLVVIFTDFADTIGAELMLENMSRLVRDHEVIFVTFPDQELEDMVAAAPQTADQVSKAVIAAGLLKERDLVFSKLHRLGVHILETDPKQVGPKLLNAYMELKMKGVL